MTDIDDDLLPDDMSDSGYQEDIGDMADYGAVPAAESGMPVDLDGDGIPDALVAETDLDGDGTPDVQEFAVDLDGDGNLDVLVQSDAAQSIWGDLDDAPADVVPEDVFGAMESVADELIFPGYSELMATSGTPEADMALWDPQDAPMSCAVATTNMMFRSMDIDVGEDLLAETLQNFGVYDPIQGSNIQILDDAINIMAGTSGLDIQAETFSGLETDDLENMLNHGIRPLIAVDGAELYSSGGERFLNDLGLLPDAPHAVQLIDIEHTSDGDYAVINDPGIPDGAGVRVPMETFKDAWDDIGNSCVAMSDTATMASVGEIGGDGPDIGLGARLEAVRSDVWGNLFRGNSQIPFSGPNALNKGTWSWGPDGCKILNLTGGK